MNLSSLQWLRRILKRHSFIYVIYGIKLKHRMLIEEIKWIAQIAHSEATPKTERTERVITRYMLQLFSPILLHINFPHPASKTK